MGASEHISDSTLRLLQRASRKLGDTYWACVADGAACGDVGLAALCVDIGERLARRAVNEETGADAPVCMSETLPLLHSGIVDSIIAGAVFMPAIARIDPSQAPAVAAEFQRLPVRARQLVLRFSAHRMVEPHSSDLYILGLNDRAKSVRECAVNEAGSTSSQRVAEELKRLATIEPDQAVRGAILQSLSLIAKGYFIGLNDEGYRDVIVSIIDGTSHSRFPDSAFVTFGEDEVMRRYLSVHRGLASPTFEEDRKWLNERRDEWARSDEFKALQKNAASSAATPNRSNPH